MKEIPKKRESDKKERVKDNKKNKICRIGMLKWKRKTR